MHGSPACGPQNGPHDPCPYFRIQSDQPMNGILRSFSLVATLLIGSAFAQWVPYVHPPYQSIYSVTTTVGAIYMVSAGQGVIKSTDGGTVWNPANTGLPAVNTVESVYYNANRLFCGTHSGVYSSTDFGASWVLTNTGLPASSGTNFATRFFHSGNATFAVFSASIGNGGGILRTTDNGANWFSGNGGLASNMVVYQIAEIGGVVYAATSVGLYSTVNLGVGWSAVPPANNYSFYAIQGTPTRMVAITAFGYRYSTNAGGTWTNSMFPATAPSANADCDLIVYDGKYWAITGGGTSKVYRSIDGGANFALYETGIQGADVIRQYRFHASGNALYMGTLGTLYSHAGTTVGVDEQGAVALPVPYPTAFQDAFTIDLRDQQEGLNIVVLDAMGREVQRRSNLPAAAIRFDRGVMPTGTYRILMVNPRTGVASMLGAVIAQ